MVCYCEAQTSKAIKPYLASNDDFYALDPEAAPDSIINYCGEYVKQVANKKAIVEGNNYIAVVVNGFIAIIFERMSKFNIMHTTI
jgi:hypothetical protein